MMMMMIGDDRSACSLTTFFFYLISFILFGLDWIEEPSLTSLLFSSFLLV